jgi:hypothetical protein
LRALVALSAFVAVLSVGATDASKGKADVRHRPKAHKHVAQQHQQCNDVRKGVEFYRSTTWEAQNELKQAHYPTSYPERRQGRCAYLGYVSHLWYARASSRTKLLHTFEIDSRRAICYVFGAYCSQAISVAWCESRWSPRATNGQYLGLFQMGSYARALFGHSTHALGQAFAAHEYFVYTGRDWSPWSCKP